MTHLNYKPHFILEDGSERPPRNYGKVKRVLVPVKMFATLMEEAQAKKSDYLNFKPYLKYLERMIESNNHFTAEGLLEDYTKLCGTDFSEVVVRKVRMPLSTAFHVEKLAKELDIPESNLVLYLFALIHYFKGGYEDEN